MSFLRIETPGLDLAMIRTNPEWAIEYHRLFDVSPDDAEKAVVNGGNGVNIWQLCFHEDLLQISNAHKELLLDVGWYPDSDSTGRYHLQMIRAHNSGKKGRDSYDWQHPIENFETRSLSDLLAKIHSIVLEPEKQEVATQTGVKTWRQPYGFLCPNCTAVLSTPPPDGAELVCHHCGQRIEILSNLFPENIRELIVMGNAKPLPVQISRDFGEFLETCPHLYPLGASLDWKRMPAHSTIEWYEKSDEEVVEWAKTLLLGNFGHVAIWYTSDEPCLLVPFEYGIANLDTLTWKAPGPRYVFGVDVRGETYGCAFHALLEITGGRVLKGLI